MQKSTFPVSNQLNLNPRSKILDSYLVTIESSFRNNSPQIKLINYGTGSGKTHQMFQAICETIERYPNVKIIGIYIAPLREHLQVPDEIVRQYPDIPIFLINSLEMKMTDEYVELYKELTMSILKNKKFWNIGAREYPGEKVHEAQQNLRKVKNAISRLEYIKREDWGDDEFNRIVTNKEIRNLNNLLEKFLEFLIKCKPDETSWPIECWKLVEIFFPLHLLREKSGLLMLTYDKFETHVPYFKHNGETWIRKNSHLDEYIVQHTSDSRKFVLAFDEQEDGYQIMLKHKVDIISPQMLAINNALSSINREFSILFSAKSHDNRAFLHFVEKNPEAFYEFEEHIGRGKSIEQNLEKLASIYRRLTVEEGNSTNFLQQMVKVNRGLDQSLEEIVGIFDCYGEGNPITLNFEMLARVFSKFENNRSLLIPHKLYNKIGNDLMNIFSYNNLYIYNIEPLKELFLTRSISGHVHIGEQQVANNASVAELIYAILAVRLQIKAIKDFLANVLDAEDSQSRSLDIWSKQITKVQKASEESLLQNQQIKYLDRTYVYKSYKSIINIMEISRYQHPANNLINAPLREVSIGSTAILTSPEHKITSILKNSGNVIFLISATGGLWGDLSTSYDMRYLEDTLRSETGQSSFRPMADDEISLCEEIRQYRQSLRQVTTWFFDEGLSSYPNKETQEIVERFEELVLKAFIDSFNSENVWFGIYKIQELQNFTRFLFYLFEDNSIQEIIAFTQTLRWIKKMLQYCEKLHHGNFVFEPSPNHPNIYYVQVRHKKYQSGVRIKVILYEASFNIMYYDKTTPRTYLDELLEEEGQKIFFISAYQSASKGLNPVVKTKTGDQKDFDSLALLMDSYYTVMGPVSTKSKDSGHATTLYHFSLMKSLVHLGDSTLEIKDFNKYLSQPEAEIFRHQQHQILLGKGILQAIGRNERRDFPNQTVKVYINEETRKNLVSFFKYLNREEPNEIRKLSVNNYRVYLSVQEEESKRTIQDYDQHIVNEIDSYFVLQEFRKSMLEEIEKFHQGKATFQIIKAWDMLRDPIVFTDPPTYLEKLHNSGLFPIDFIESLFYRKSAQMRFTPHLAFVEEDGKKISILSDSINGDRIYPYQKKLYPEYLKTNSRDHDLEGNEIMSLNPSTDFIYRLYNKLLPQPKIFDSYVPRPQFFFDVLYPSLTEHFTERWIQDIIFKGKSWEAIKSSYGYEPLLDFDKYNKLYERFDLYYIKDNNLFCIDVKAWSRASGNRLSKKTLEKAHNKLNVIASNYPEFTQVRGLLLNLHAPQEKNHYYLPALFSGNLIYFDDHSFPVESSILQDFLFEKELQHA